MKPVDLPTTWRLARRTERMNPSIIREILKLTEQPGIISLAGGLPSPDTFPVEAMREATARVLRDAPREALQYAASEGYGPLREWVAAHLRRAGPARRRVAGADHHRLAAGAGPRRQGADRCRQPRGGRVADLPRRAAGLRAVRAGVRAACDCDDDGPLPERRVARAAGARFLYVLPNFQNPSGRCMGEARRDAAGRRPPSALGLPLVEDNPYGDLWFDAPPPAAAGRALARRRDLPRLVLQGAGAGPAPRLRRSRRRRSSRSCCRPSRRPTCTRRASTSAWCTR